MSEFLKMSFDPNTIEHLGVRLYSTLPPVLAELIANSYDADANNVRVVLNDENDKREIVVEDDGMGMSFEEINDKFLRIGRNRRQEEEKQTTLKGRKIIGKKGLGKLSFFGIAHEIEITTRKDGKENTFKMVWEDIKKAEREYQPTVVKQDVPCQPEKTGTTIVLRRIQRKSKFSPEDIANGLARLFIVDPKFRIEIRHNSDEPIVLENERRYAGLEKEVEWKIPDDIPDDFEYKGDYDKEEQVTGQLIAMKKPIPPNTNVRGIILFSRKKMVNAPGYFSNSVSSHFFSYLTGWLEVDFIDDLEDDVITTARQSLNWEHEEMKKLQQYLRRLIRWLERNWREKRKQAREKEIKRRTDVDIQSWYEKVPDAIRKPLRFVVDAINQNSETPEEAAKVIQKIHSDMVPEYPNYHWRHLHEEVKRASKADYKKTDPDYYRAAAEALKMYTTEVKRKSGSNKRSDYDVMEEAFGTSGLLSVSQKFKKPDGSDFPKTTKGNIENGQQRLSIGTVTGFRNPLAHEQIQELKKSGLFTEKDCLDLLSLLSHLFRRLDDA